MKQKRRSLLGLYTIGIAAVFLMGFLLLVVFGALSYRFTVETQNRNNQKREVLAYLINSVASNRSGTISVDQDVLVIPDGESGYALRIYVHEGELLEDYGKIGSALSFEDANVIGETNTFVLNLQGAMLEVETDEGSVVIFTGGAQ